MTTDDVMTAKLRRLEARVAMLEDAVQVYGPPPRRLAVPELSPAQRQTLTFGLLFLALFTLSAIATRKVES